MTVFITQYSLWFFFIATFSLFSHHLISFSIHPFSLTLTLGPFIFSGPLALMGCHLLSDLSNTSPSLPAPLSDLSLKNIQDGNPVDSFPSVQKSPIFYNVKQDSYLNKSLQADNLCAALLSVLLSALGPAHIFQEHILKGKWLLSPSQLPSS